MHVEPVLGTEIADRQQPAFRIEKKRELHLHGESASGRLDRLQPVLKRGRDSRRLCGVATTALDRPQCGFDPEQHVRADFVVPLAAERPGKVGGGRRVARELVRLARQIRGHFVEGALQLGGRHQVCAPVVGQREQGLAGERQTVSRAGRDSRCVGRRTAPRRAGVGNGDQMAGEVPAVDRRDVRRLERAKIARVVPIIEMSAKTPQPSHRRKRCLEPLHGLERADPAEIAGGDGRQQQEPEIGR